MKKSLRWLMPLGVLLLIGCANKNDANEKNFSEALNSYLAKRGQLCLGTPWTWPVVLLESERRSGMAPAAEMDALEKEGLVRSHEMETEYAPPLGRPFKARVVQYELTDNGKKFYQEKPFQSLGGTNILWLDGKPHRGDFCFGKQALDKIIKWEGPNAADDPPKVSILYTYKIENLAEWAKNADVQRVFPGIVSTIDGAGKTAMNQALTLTSRGWEPSQ
jgi:hypothetical protein